MKVWAGEGFLTSFFEPSPWPSPGRVLCHPGSFSVSWYIAVSLHIIASTFPSVPTWPASSTSPQYSSTCKPPAVEHLRSPSGVFYP